MKIKNWVLIVCLLCFITEVMKAQVYSFENKKVPKEWSIDGGKLEVSRLKYKEGKQSLKVVWDKNTIVRFTGKESLDAASRSVNVGLQHGYIIRYRSQNICISRLLMNPEQRCVGYLLEWILKDGVVCGLSSEKIC